MNISTTCRALGNYLAATHRSLQARASEVHDTIASFGHQIPPLRTNGRGLGNRDHRNQIPRKDVSHIRIRQLPWAVTSLVTVDDKPKGHIFTSRPQSLVMLHLCQFLLWILQTHQCTLSNGLPIGPELTQK